MCLPGTPSCHVYDVMRPCDIIFLTCGHAVLCPIRDVVEEGNGKRMCPLLKQNNNNNKKEQLNWRVNLCGLFQKREVSISSESQNTAEEREPRKNKTETLWLLAQLTSRVAMPAVS